MNMFSGTATAIITPFKKDGSVDEEALRKLVDFQEKNGVGTIVPCGSTGESATLSPEEHVHVVSIVIDQAKKAKIVAGAGSNSTSEAINFSRSVMDLGADGILSISPYYNKPTQEGIYQHYKAISEAVDIPIVVYNVPGRTGSNITAETTLRMAELDGIAAVKEASGNMEQIQMILAERPKGFLVLSGDDALTFPMMALGAEGTISVASNCIPKEVSTIVDLCRRNKFIEARDIHLRMMPLFKGLFMESNPIPIKYIMKKLGFTVGTLRLPLTEISAENKKRMDAILAELNIR